MSQVTKTTMENPAPALYDNEMVDVTKDKDGKVVAIVTTTTSTGPDPYHTGPAPKKFDADFSASQKSKATMDTTTKTKTKTKVVKPKLKVARKTVSVQMGDGMVRHNSEPDFLIQCNAAPVFRQDMETQTDFPDEKQSIIDKQAEMIELLKFRLGLVEGELEEMTASRNSFRDEVEALMKMDTKPKKEKVKKVVYKSELPNKPDLSYSHGGEKAAERTPVEIVENKSDCDLMASLWLEPKDVKKLEALPYPASVDSKGNNVRKYGTIAKLRKVAKSAHKTVVYCHYCELYCVVIRDRKKVDGMMTWDGYTVINSSDSDDKNYFPEIKGY